MSDAFDQYLILEETSESQSTSINPTLTWDDGDRDTMTTIHSQSSLAVQMQMFPASASNALGLSYAGPLYLQLCDTFGTPLIPISNERVAISASSIQLAAPFSYTPTPALVNPMATVPWKRPGERTEIPLPSILENAFHVNEPSEPSGSSPAGTGPSDAASSNGSVYACSTPPPAPVIKVEEKPQVVVEEASDPLEPSRPATPQQVLSTPRPVVSKRKRVEVESDVEENADESDYQDSGCDSESDSDTYSLYAEHLPYATVKPSPKKGTNPSSSKARSKATKVTGPAPKRARLNNGEAKDINPLGDFICGEIVKYKGKGSQYTMKGLTTPEVGDVCMMRCVNQTDMNRHRLKTLWHCEPKDCWTCEICGKVMNARVDNQTRHTPKCRGNFRSYGSDSEDEAGYAKVSKKSKTKKSAVIRKGKKRAD